MADVVIVTGGSRGIGSATVRELASRGWDVAFTYRTDHRAAQATIDSCHHTRQDVKAYQVDVTVEEEIVALFEMVDDAFGRLGALVNNAGINAPPARVEDLTAEPRIGLMFATNVYGPFLTAREAIRRMSNRHGGSGGVIVNVSSAASRLGGPGEFVDYASSKGAIDTMTLGLAREVAGEQIRVNAVRPGLIETEMHAANGQSDRLLRLTPLIPMQRPGTPREVAETIAWLCSPQSSYVTGALLDVSGGR